MVQIFILFMNQMIIFLLLYHVIINSKTEKVGIISAQSRKTFLQSRNMVLTGNTPNIYGSEHVSKH